MFFFDVDLTKIYNFTCRKFITNLFFLLVLNLLKALLYTRDYAEIINRVGADTYGIYFSLFNFFSFQYFS